MLFEVTKLRIWKQLTTKNDILAFRGRLFEVTKLRIWKQLTTRGDYIGYSRTLFEVTKLRIWKQLTTNNIRSSCTICCLRSQSYEFESNSQHKWFHYHSHQSCLRSQSYEFESNSQQPSIVLKYLVCCLRSQSYEFESNSQLVGSEVGWGVWLFEVTKLQIWKQLTTGSTLSRCVALLFEVTKLRIWKQLTTPSANLATKNEVVWGHKVTNLKITHNNTYTNSCFTS